MYLYKGTNGPHTSIYRSACFSFIILINFTLFKSLKVDGRSKIWTFLVISQEPLKSLQKGLCIKNQAAKGRNDGSYLFKFYSVGMGNLKKDPVFSRPQLYLLSHFCTWNKMLL